MPSQPIVLDEPIELVDYRASWVESFGAERERLVAALRAPIETVQHVGSTAVPGMLSKPTIDLMLGLSEFPPSASLISSVSSLGYESLGEAGVPGRLYFRRRGSASFNIHVVRIGGLHWVSNLALRDYLLANAAARERYAQAKRAAFAYGGGTLLAYSAAKSAIVSSLCEEALALQNGI